MNIHPRIPRYHQEIYVVSGTGPVALIPAHLNYPEGYIGGLGYPVYQMIFLIIL